MSFEPRQWIDYNSSDKYRTKCHGTNPWGWEDEGAFYSLEKQRFDFTVSAEDVQDMDGLCRTIRVLCDLSFMTNELIAQFCECVQETVKGGRGKPLPE